MKKQANPQGKGVVPVLDVLQQSKSLVPIVAKQIDQISSELFTSLFVLHSQFQFKPVEGKHYWLYQRDNQFHLSLISPQEWGSDSFGLYVAECVLQADITWSLTLDPCAANNLSLMAYIENKRDEFEQALKQAKAVGNVLPFYLEALPFYQRVFASALASSLKASMMKSGIHGMHYSKACQLLALSVNEMPKAEKDL